MTSVRRTASALLAVPLLALGACTGEELEPIMPTESASSTPSASEPSPTPQPWEMKTDDGAVAFVEHWFELFNRARLEGRTDELSDVSTEDCATCGNFVDLAARLHSPGAFYESKPWKIEQISSPNHLDRKVWQIVVRIFQPSAWVKLPGQDGKRRTDPARKTMTATIHWASGRWQMYELVFVR